MSKARFYPIFSKETKEEFMIQVDSILENEDNPDTEVIVGSIYPLKDGNTTSSERYSEIPVFTKYIPFNEYGYESDNRWAHLFMELYDQSLAE